MSNDPRFIHLRTHSEYSLLEGALRLKKLPDLCKKHDMPALALTDTNNMFAALEYSVTLSGAGIQPIIGCQVDVTWVETRPGDRPRLPAGLVLLAQNETGYENLMKLNSCLYLKGDGQLPQVTLDELEALSAGLICLTGGPEGPVGQLLRAGQQPAAQAMMDRLAAAFPQRLYVELQRHPGPDGQPDAEKLTERPFVEMAYAMELPLVATNDVYFPAADMYEAHDALICIAEGAYVDQQQDRRRLTNQHYFKSQSEMVTLFADLPEAVQNTVEIAKRCAFMAYRRDPILPKFADDEVVELRRQANEGLQARLAVIPHAASVEEYQKRLDFELDIIEGMGFPGYFLIVADFIKWAKDENIPVGPGRGSGAGSLVAYALTITDLDPLRYALLFERFLNPERVSMPDFDIDFCMDRREEVIRYVQRKYGRDKVGQIITFGALLSKAAVRDIGRVLQMPYGQVDRLSKLIPVEGVKPVSIAKALIDEPRLRDEARNEEVVKRLLDYGQQVEGLLRNASTHAAGVVIGDRPLDALVPLYQDPRSDMPATQFNMKWVEQAGLVKFDFLGLKTLTVIQNAVDQIRNAGRDLHISADGTQLYEPAPGTENDINAIPLDDEASYKLYAAAKTVAVFQVESSGMMDALKRMKPTCIEDIVALVALYRPGPMENIPTYCEVKNGQRERENLHPTIDHILDETQGIIVYQEQVMQIAQEMAGYSLGGADLLRRAMGKKIQEAMDAERPKFLEGAKANGVDKDKAMEVWNLLDKFANYGFNKSHAAAYAVVSYQTAWLKANHPVEFMAGVMNCDIHLTDKLAIYFEEVRKAMDLPWVPPCVNRSDATFKVVDGALVYALGALKNVGVEAMKLVTEGRKVDGVDKPFATLFDLARRVDLKRVGKRPLEMLARSGAFDQLDNNRRRVFDALDALVQYSAAIHDQKNSNQVSLFGEAGDDLPEPRMMPGDDYMPAERLSEEFKAVGFYLSGHPLDDYAGALKRKGVQTLDEVLADVERRGAKNAKLAGVVAGCQIRKSAKGNRFAFAQLSDTTGAYEVTLFSEALEKSQDFLVTGAKVIITAEATMESDQLKLLARSVAPIDAVVADVGGMGLRVFINDAGAVGSIATVLEGAAQSQRSIGRGPVQLCLMGAGLNGEVDVELGDDFPVNPQIKGAIKSLGGVVSVEEI
ncbi:DNA polymerase III subunit alpha [Pseudosulfitobacter pseudonitzschiae]|uniref:DNA polymerase III subunit alpha n=1 Tax=Pseudosulfitobacter pseudonitzschiae TaxID=1402135 RepID=UPI001AF1F20B|nr:DNA polymerase III subunit alpha [Pseudosulfitobacter pseudonitzschiae]MBM1816301.1 DNA polymerase III subunit alpha [Pseudosulfitobacter pseudonitzschiae]MBM1833814.1 DNA polymerase III subunit alpha [Pseudosulfitobacter pseudonitzschiae]MBM1838680.1 DNA polymerase III subunit alpha [Pseudosulfitobacter pseudonitzschiae]MBM1843028.1 DNA polymerase III subunit alpha [Pseudosulfitobacter pseudonitzschiae]MBM1847894.1 DNA polymerase III subunit alpha [Pseudosulfitobacter pseudonitzschiae]